MQDVIHVEFLLMVLAAALYPGAREQRLAACAAITSGLALASIAAAPVAEVSPEASGSSGFAAVEGTLFVLAAALALGSAVSAMCADRRAISVATSAAAAASGAGFALRALPFAFNASLGTVAAALVALVGAGLLLLATGSRLVARSPVPLSFPVTPPFGPAKIAMAAIGAGALLAAAGPSVGAVFIGAMMAATGGWLARRSPGRRVLPAAPIVTLGLLLPAWWLMATIAGPEGLAIASLPDLPWSPAAERLLAPVLLLSAWAMSGLLPLHRQEPAPLTAPVAALLVGRVAIPAVPDGLGHWRPLAMPVILLALWHGALTRRRAEIVAGAAWFGLVTVTPVGVLGAALLLVGGLGLELADRLPALGGALERGVGAAATLLVGAGALFAIEGGLMTEVTYTMAAVAALVAAVGSRGAPQASTASAPRATAPSA